MSAAQADWDDQHRLPRLTDWLASLPQSEQQSLAAQYADKLARMLGPQPVSQETGE